MNSMSMLLVFGGLMFLNAMIVFALLRTNIQFNNFIVWLNQKQTELLGIEKNTDSLSKKMKDCITLFSYWVLQSKNLLIPIAFVAQGLVAVAYMSAAEGTFFSGTAFILSLIQSAVIVFVYEIVNRIRLSVNVIGEINEEYIKLTVKDDLDKEIEKIEGGEDNGET